MTNIHSIAITKIPCPVARRKRLGIRSASSPATKVPSSADIAMKLKTVAVTVTLSPRLSRSDTMWNTSPVLISDCDELVKSKSQKVRVRTASLAVQSSV